MAKNFPLSLYYSVTQGAVPEVTNLDRGTPAFNIVDKKMFLRVTTDGTKDSPESDTLLTFDLTPQALEALSNVTISGAANGQVLKFNGSEWVNATLTVAEISDFVEKVQEAITGDETIVRTTGAQSVAGVKTFSEMPVITAGQGDVKTGSADEVAKLGTVKTQTVYTDTSENGATVAIGGIPKGKKYENANVIDVLNDLLHPYVAPSAVNLTMSGTNGGVFEMGDSKEITEGTVRWTNGSTKVNKAEILVGGEAKGEATVDGVVTSQTVTLTKPMTVKANTTFTARVTESSEDRQVTGGNVTFTFVYPFYWGVLEAGVPVDEGAVKGLSKHVETKSNKSATYDTAGTEKRLVFAYPASYGNLKSVIDPNGFDNIDKFSAGKTSVSITGLDGTPQSYNVYVANSNVENMKFTFNF